MQIAQNLTPADLAVPLTRLFDLAARKALHLDRTWDPTRGTPVCTIDGHYTTRGWTQWTEGFLYGLALLAFDATGQHELLDLGRGRITQRMAAHVTHHGVHDHGFNNLSTYGNLRRLMREGRIPFNAWELAYYELAIKASAGTQAARWSPAADNFGYIYSFNGPHSLFVDTLRTLRILGLAHQLGHVLLGENDTTISLLSRVVTHGLTTARYNIYYGAGRDHYDTPARRGRTAHEAIFNTHDGRFRCPNSQQGYSPFSTWTRGLAWAMLGFAEQLEFFAALAATGADVLPPEVRVAFEQATLATCDFYIDQAAAADGICYWDTGAPGLAHLADFRTRPADPFNAYEPVDASAAAIAAQGLLRLGRYLDQRDAHHSVADSPGARASRCDGAKQRYTAAGLTIARTLLTDAYLATDPKHEGLLLHSVYHRPNGWDQIPAGQQVPCGQSSLWGDYHLLELGVYLQRLAANGPYYCFFDAPGTPGLPAERNTP